MPCDPNFLARIKMSALPDEDDRLALATVVDELIVPPGDAVRGPH